MAKGPPKTVTIRPDDYHAEYVGRTADDRQFFLTTPFVPAENASILHRLNPRKALPLPAVLGPRRRSESLGGKRAG